MRLDITKTLKLDYLGDGWEECYLSFRPISIKEAREMQALASDEVKLVEAGLAVIKDKFVDGRVLSEGKVVPIKAKDLEDLPVGIMSRAIMMLNSADSEKKIS